MRVKLGRYGRNCLRTGRELGSLTSPFSGQDKLFASARLDGQTVEGGRYNHCTFANISFKEVTLRSCSFLNCAFLGCYFRRSTLHDTSFVGCRFIDCDFPRVAVQGCDFRYSKFSRCLIPFDEIQLSLPREPNLREELARNLAVEAANLGLADDGREFRMCAIQSREEDLRAAMKAASTWYQEHYDTWRRFMAMLRLVRSILTRWLWGYGERAHTLVINSAVLSLLIFPALFYWKRAGLVNRTGGEIGAFDVLWFSLKNFLPSGVESDLIAHTPTLRAISGFEGLVGVIAAGLLASYLFRWILDR